MEAKLQALKVPDLKKLLQDASLPVSGTKAELIKRLLESPQATSSLGGGGEEEEEDLLGEIEADAPPAEVPKDQAAKSTPANKTPTVVPSAKKEESSTLTTTPAPKSQEDQKAALVAELEKRKARAARWGLSTGEAEAKLERAIKFGVEASQDKALNLLDSGLKGGKRREEKADKKGSAIGANAAAVADVTSTSPKKDENKVPASKPAETEEEKSARLARKEADEAAKRKRAERFGLQAPATAAATTTTTINKSQAVDSAEEEKKRKRMEKFATTTSAEPVDKKIKA